ncbi:MAG: hypothetical protein HC849_14275 [Oscillatoriales cyanobacterium RU_3_3]|nr:hypothetical protein [Oscillatoriales cyanobacterium RU_3_3]
MSYSPVLPIVQKKPVLRGKRIQHGQENCYKREALKFPYHLPQDASWQAGKIALTVPAG